MFCVSRNPSGRLEVIQLMNIMDDMLEKAGVDQETEELTDISEVGRQRSRKCTGCSVPLLLTLLCYMYSEKYKLVQHQAFGLLLSKFGYM